MRVRQMPHTPGLLEGVYAGVDEAGWRDQSFSGTELCSVRTSTEISLGSAVSCSLRNSEHEFCERFREICDVTVDGAL
jgi:hypothetical protein